MHEIWKKQKRHGHFHFKPKRMDYLTWGCGVWKVSKQNAWATRNSKQNALGPLHLDCNGLPKQRLPPKKKALGPALDGIGQSMLAQTHAPAAILSQMAEAVAVSVQTHGSVRIILVHSVWPGRVDRLSKPIGKPTINRLILTSLTSSIGGST